MQSTIIFDIETASQPLWLGQQAISAGVDGPTYCLDHAGDGALSPATGQVIAFAAIIDDSAPVALCHHDERVILDRIDDLVGKYDVVVAHNGHSFDFPFLRARALHHGLPALAAKFWQAKPWDGRLVDTTDPSWCPRPQRPTKGWGYSLDMMAALLGVERDAESIPSGDVPLAWYRGDYEAVCQHVLDDCVTLHRVYKLLLAGRR